MDSSRQRHAVILERLRAEQRAWRVDELAAHTGVSPVTIRRDLDELARQGSIIRTHGGCLYAGRMALEAAYHRRVATNYPLKRAIGNYAARQVRTGERILIDDGSTCFHVASQLDRDLPISLFTNSMPILAEMADCPMIGCTLLGGDYDVERQHLGGPLTQWTLERLSFDRVFVGADAVDAQGRCLVQTAEIAQTTQEMLRRGGFLSLLADHTKVRTTSPGIAYGKLDNFDEWITTDGLGPAERHRFDRLTKITTTR